MFGKSCCPPCIAKKLTWILVVIKICCAGAPAGLTGCPQPIGTLARSAYRPIGRCAVCSSAPSNWSRHLCWSVAQTGDTSSSVNSTRILTGPPAAKRAPCSFVRNAWIRICPMLLMAFHYFVIIKLVNEYRYTNCKKKLSIDIRNEQLS